MPNKLFLTHDACEQSIRGMAQDIRLCADIPDPNADLRIYPVPRGGIPVAYLLKQHFPKAIIVDNPVEANIIVDDLVDSGATRQRYKAEYPVPFIALYDKAIHGLQGTWIVFPWEQGEGDHETSAEDIGVRLLQFIGENPEREGLLETPKRWLAAMKHWTGGYGVEPESVMKVFEDGAEGCDEMVLVRDVPFFSLCEHHITPIVGVAHVAYIPDGKIIGLSKLARLVDIYARRLQVQERMGNQVADAIEKFLKPLGCGVIIEARHLCMESRGIQKQGNYTITSSLRGVFKEDSKAREEFLMLTRGQRNAAL
jgi:GTP cyclohydrolase I